MSVIVKIGKTAKAWWKHLTMSADEIYLNGATDLADLEHRLRTVSHSMTNKH